MKPSITAITFITIIFIIAAVDWYIIVHKKKSPPHGVIKFVIFGFVSIMHGIYIAKVHAPKDWAPDDYTMAVILLYPTLIWTFFDAFLNKLRGLSLLYIGKGSDAEDDGGTDKFFENKTPLYIITKVIAFILSGVAFYIMIQEYK